MIGILSFFVVSIPFTLNGFSVFPHVEATLFYGANIYFFFYTVEKKLFFRNV